MQALAGLQTSSNDSHLAPVRVVLFNTVVHGEKQLVITGDAQCFAFSVHQPCVVAEPAHRVDPVDDVTQARIAADGAGEHE